MTILKYKLFEEAGDDGAAGGGGEGDNPGGDGGQAGGSAISGGVDAVAVNELIPEKYRVFGEAAKEGEDAPFDLEASTRKLADGYSNLAKRLGTDEPPPDSPDGYEIDKESFEGMDIDTIMSDEKTKGFLKRMHAKGASNAMIQEVMEFGLKEFAPTLGEGNAVLSTDDCVKSLKTDVWKSDQEFTENMRAANRAFKSLPEELRAIADKELGNNPAFNRVMALLGKEMAEDTPPNDTATLEQQATIEEKMMSEAYRDPKHPQHERVSKEVSAYFAKKHPGKAV